MDRADIKARIADSLKAQSEIERIIVFGSFVTSDAPNDVDIAVVQNSTASYLTLAMRYRKLVREIAKEIAIDIFPVVEKTDAGFFLNEINRGEVIYARAS